MENCCDHVFGGKIQQSSLLNNWFSKCQSCQEWFQIDPLTNNIIMKAEPVRVAILENLALQQIPSSSSPQIA